MEGKEWFVGSRHDELLEATKQMRETQQRIQMHAVSRKKQSTPATQQQRSTSQHELIAHIKELFEDNYDEVFDVFTELDEQSNGKLTKREFCDGLNAILNVGAGKRKVSNKDLEDLFNAADRNHTGTVSLKEFLDFFGKHKFGKKAGKGSTLEKGFTQNRRKRPFDEVRLNVSCVL